MVGRYVNLGPENALFDIRLGKQMHVLSGCGLGGGSLVNAGLAFQPEPWVFKQTHWTEPVAGDGHLCDGFDRAEKMLGVSHCPGGTDLLKFRSLQACASQLALDDSEASAELVPSTINYQPQINEAHVMQSACTLCGDCWMGCNVGAKNTVTITYLSDAWQFGASLFTGVSVKYVRKESNEWVLFYEQLDERNGKIRGQGSVTANFIVLSAGVFGTTEILMRSAKRGLALSKQLGRGFSANGDDLAFGHDMPERVNGIAAGHPPRTRLEPSVDQTASA
jgi:cholesterol oxidase